MVYEPREDSELLRSAVARFARGKVIDVGTGSGVLAKEAMSCADVSSVIATDIDPDAVQAAKALDVDAVEADLFVDETFFDTIICNAPYLPSEAPPDVALDGGRRGFEWTLRFLEHALLRLNRGGQILLLVSSRTNPGVVQQWLLEHACSWEVVATERLFMEELFVYRILWALPDYPHAMFLARGKRSRVYRDGDVALKVMPSDRVSREARMLRIVNEHGIGPRFISEEDTVLRMEFVPGPAIREFLDCCSVEDRDAVFATVEDQLRVLDGLGINKAELKNPYKHIIVSPRGPVLVDWERARHSHRPQNVAQFCEYVKRVTRERKKE